MPLASVSLQFVREAAALLEHGGLAGVCELVAFHRFFCDPFNVSMSHEHPFRPNVGRFSLGPGLVIILSTIRLPPRYG
jgi:hypothetical protein